MRKHPTYPSFSQYPVANITQTFTLTKKFFLVSEFISLPRIQYVNNNDNSSSSIVTSPYIKHFFHYSLLQPADISENLIYIALPSHENKWRLILYI